MNEKTQTIDTDVLIIGKGPAGLQAALYTARAGLLTEVAAHSAGSLALAERVENYYGLQAPVSGSELQRIGESQARSFGASIRDCQVVGLGYSDNGAFHASTTSGDYCAKSILIATGVKREKVPVDGIELFDGKGVSYCAVCDGFLYRGKKTGVLGYGEYAFTEARELAAINGRVSIFTNNETPDFGIDPDDMDQDIYEIVTTQIRRLEGEERLGGLRFQDGSFRAVDGLFIAYGAAGSSDLARKLGIIVDGKDNIITDQNQETNIPGVFAAGDCTGVFRQIAVAVGQGAIAAKNIIEYVRKKNHSPGV